MLISEKCAQILNCRAAELRDRLNHPADRALVIEALSGMTAETTYPDRNGLSKTFVIGDLTRRGADSTMAYGRLGRPFNVCVAAHFYVRHRIKLHNPYLQCVIEKFPDGQEDRYYPLELCKLISEEKPKISFGKLFKEIGADDDLDTEMQSGRDECSQDQCYSMW